MFMPHALVGFGYSTFEVGVIYSAAPFMRFLLPFLFKYYLKFTSNVYLLALLFTFLGSALFLLTVHNFWMHLVANLLFGGAMGIILPFVETISLKKLSKSIYGKIRLWGSVGFILIALWLGKIEVTPIATIYFLIVMGFFTLIFGYMILQFDEEHKVGVEESDKSFSLKKYWAFWVSIFLMQVAFGGFYTFFTI
jgi:PPP family 3-phenylpropionic acid transporter